MSQFLINVGLKVDNYIEKFQVADGENIEFSRGGDLGFYAIASGNLAIILRKGDAGRIIRICGEGDLAGFGVWILPEFKGAYFMTSLGGSEVHFVRHSKYLELRKKVPEINDLVNEILCKIIMMKDERIYGLENHTVVKRVALLLLNLCKRFGTDIKEGRLIDIYFSRETLAGLSGTTTESFARAITDLEERKLIVRIKRKIVVKSESKLEKVK